MSTTHIGPRYTLRGSLALERHMGATVARAAGLVAKHFHPCERRALVLLGGYGRGEGGVIRERGEERPHNNIDFLLVTTPWSALRKKTLKRRLDAALAPIVMDEEIGIDTGVISAFELQHAPARVFFFDLRWGHRTILGDSTLIPLLAPLAATEIEMEDVHNLLVNRASLLVINDALLDRGIASENEARFIIKHLMKSIIGHGDAFLFTHKRYHASYLEKQWRMREFANVVPGLAELYEIAAEFRFSPDYTRYRREDLIPFTERVRSILRLTHLEFERFRTGVPNCTFSNHVERVLDAKPHSFSRFNHAWPHSFMRPLHYAYRRTRGLTQSRVQALRQSHPRLVLAAALPTVLYGSNDEQSRLVQQILGAVACTPRALREAYMRHWSEHGDPNFYKTAKDLGLSLNDARSSK